MELETYLVVARGSPPIVQALTVERGGRRAGWEALVPATGAARPSAVAVDRTDQYLYYCDVHR